MAEDRGVLVVLEVGWCRGELLERIHRSRFSSFAIIIDVDLYSFTYMDRKKIVLNDNGFEIVNDRENC